MKLTTHLHPSAEVKNAWSYTSTPLFVCTALCLIKHQGKFYLFTSQVVTSFGALWPDFVHISHPPIWVTVPLTSFYWFNYSNNIRQREVLYVSVSNSKVKSVFQVPWKWPTQLAQIGSVMRIASSSIHWDVTNSMEQSPSWKANSHSAKETPCLLWNLKVCYHVDNSPPWDPILSKIYPVYTLH
jgi:hypothetical protein